MAGSAVGSAILGFFIGVMNYRVTQLTEYKKFSIQTLFSAQQNFDSFVQCQVELENLLSALYIDQSYELAHLKYTKQFKVSQFDATFKKCRSLAYNLHNLYLRTLGIAKGHCLVETISNKKVQFTNLYDAVLLEDLDNIRKDSDKNSKEFLEKCTEPVIDEMALFAAKLLDTNSIPSFWKQISFAFGKSN